MEKNETVLFKPGFVSRVVETSLKRKVGVLVLFFSLLVIGLIATSRIPRELAPSGFVGQSIFVSVPWSNVPTKEIMEKLTIPLEDELSTVKGLDRMSSTVRVGNTGVQLTFKQDVDMDVAYREVRDRVQRAKLTFPDDVDRFYINKEDSSSMPIAMVGLTVPPGVTDSYNLIHDKIITPLSRVDGIARISTEALQEKEILIDIDRSKAEASGINLYEVAEELRGDNFTLASGFIRKGNAKLALRSVAEYNNVGDLENRPLTRTTKVKDIGVVKYELPEKMFSVRVNGQEAYALEVKKEGTANTVATCKRLKKAIAAFGDDPSLKGFEIDAFFDQGQMIEESLMNLTDSGSIGGVLAAAVLFFFLKRVRMTLIISLSIPVSLLMALTAMYFYGETLNVLTMLALVICIGLLVDNSVVVAENIFRLMEAGYDRKTACIRGVSEIALAISMATLTTIVVFVPISLISGEAQFFITKLSVPIIVSLLGSLVVALLFIPLGVFITQRSRRPDSEKSSQSNGIHTIYKKFHDGLNGVLDKAYQYTFGKISIIYTGLLKHFLNNRLGLFFTMVLAFGITNMIATKNVKVVPTQEEDNVMINIGIQMSQEYDFDDTAEYYKEAEKIVAGLADEIGLEVYIMIHFSSGGQIQAFLDKTKNTGFTAKEAMQRIGDALPKPAGVRLFYGQDNKNEENRQKATFTFQFYGEDADKLKELTDNLEPLLEQIPGVIGVRYRERRNPNELALVMNREKLSASNINPRLVAGVINYALQGQMLSRYNMDGKEIPIRARFQKEDREKLDDLLSFQIPAADFGGVLPLSALTNPEFNQTPSGVWRLNRRVSRSISLDLDPEKADETRANLMALRSSLDLPEGITYEFPGTSISQDQIMEVVMLGLLAVLFIYLLMSFLFESFILPLSIVFTIPLASIGVIWAHYLGDKDLDMLGMIGAILLIGVVVNNGIVLIDYVNRLRIDGMSRAEALVLATQRRFKPITMTALTTIIGMIPLTISPPNSMGISYKSFGMTLIGGMTSATLLTLLVVPVFYTFFDDARVFAAHFLRRIFTNKNTSSIDSQKSEVSTA